MPQGLTPAAQAELFEQRRESLAVQKKQQEERLLAMRSNHLPSSSLAPSDNLVLGVVGTNTGPTSSNTMNLAPGFTIQENHSGNSFIGGSVLFGGVSGNGGTTIRSSNPVSRQPSSDNVTHNSSVGESYPVPRRSGTTMTVGGSGFNSSLPLAPGGSSLRKINGNNDNNNLVGGNGSRITHNNVNSNGNNFGLDKHGHGQHNIENSPNNFRGQGWSENEVPGFTGGSLFGNSSFGMSGGGIWGNDNGAAAGSSSNSLSVASSGTTSVGQLRFPSGSLSPVGTTRSSIPNHSSGNDIRAVVGGGNLLGNNPFVNDSGSSTLASMLGIDLPTGSGSLRETNITGAQHMFPANNSFPPTPHNRANQETLWGISQQNTIEEPNYLHPNNFGPRSTPHSSQGAIGSSPIRNDINSRNVGGTAIGGAVGTSNGFQSNLTYAGSGTSDIALLQSLLPGVHITSGNAQQPAASTSNAPGNPIGWKSTLSAAPEPSSSHNHIVVRRPMKSEPQEQNTGPTNSGGNADTWGGVSGLYTRNPNVQHQSAQSSIW